MQEKAICTERLSKVYKLYNKPVDRLKESINPFRRKYHRDFYALRDISFEVKKGETVGIIGKNGSGKSTLLKIITGVLTPTAGNVYTNGKVSALLELGAGFNPEFTGIENIYLHGTIMGYTKEEMDAKMQAILSFADIGDYIYQPVKTYSSGMFVRLAFACAINVDPDILIIDEALAVGDMRFQQKCYRKIRDFKEKGTVLLVSHDTGAITNFCDRVIWLENGEKYKEGTPDEILEEYHAFMTYDADLYSAKLTEQEAQIEDSELFQPLPGEVSSFGNGNAKIVGVSLVYSGTKKVINTLHGNEKVDLLLKIHVTNDIYMPIIGFNIKDKLGNPIIITNTEFEGIRIKPLLKDTVHKFKWSFIFPKLRDGTYSFDIAIAEGTFLNHQLSNWIYDALFIKVVSNERYSSNRGLIILDIIDFNEFSSFKE
jgi:ABC-type polysaccharide/polyol phosphate transport system ATPase subunit